MRTALLCTLVLAVVTSLGAVAYPDTAPERPAACPGSQRALVLGGGGVKGAYQAGAVWYLVNKLGCDFDFYFGTSTGAVSAALLAQVDSYTARKHGADKAAWHELRQFVDTLIRRYTDLTDQSQLVNSYSAGPLRLLVPHWIGGVDGLNSLDPLAAQLRKELTPARIRFDHNLMVRVVSLQCGADCLQPPRSEPDDKLDLIIGSASVPIGIEPKRARIWLRVTTLERLARDDVLELTSSDIGLDDPACRIRFEPTWEQSCKHLGSELLSQAPCPPRLRCDRWRTRLYLPGLADEDRARIRDLISASFRRGADLPVQFTTLHQLVDGGVVENLPLAFPARYLAGYVDTVFVLAAGDSQRGDDRSEFRGGLRIGSRVLEWHWEAFERSALDSAVVPILYNGYIDRYVQYRHEYRNEVMRRLGPKEVYKLEDEMSVKPPGRDSARHPHTNEGLRLIGLPEIWYFEPQKILFKETFDTNPDKIKEALNHGCTLVAHLVRDKKVVRDLQDLLQAKELRVIREQVSIDERYRMSEEERTRLAEKERVDAEEIGNLREQVARRMSVKGFHSSRLIPAVGREPACDIRFPYGRQ